MSAGAAHASSLLSRRGPARDAASDARRDATSWRTLGIRGVHLAVLWSFAIVQPLFADLERNAEFFVARGNTGGDILLFAFFLVLVPPAIMLLVEVGAAFFVPQLAGGIHVALVGFLAAVVWIGLLKRVLPDTSAVLLPAAALAGAGTAIAYTRLSGLRTALTVLVVAPVVFLAGFLLFSPVAQLIGNDQGAATASAAASRTPVVLVIFDELPAISLMSADRRIDSRLVPNFGTLAATSTWYRNATTVADGTYVAVPAILTGRRPVQRLPTSRQYPDSVFTLVGKRYDIHALEPITHVCPTKLCGPRQRDAAGTRLGSLASDLEVVAGHLVLPADIAASLPPIDRDYEDFGDEGDGVATTARAADVTRVAGRRVAGSDKFAERLRNAERFVRSVRRPGVRPPLYMGHFEVPHVPWRILPSGRQYPVEGPKLPGLRDQTWGSNAYLVAQATQRHMLQVGYADRLLGRMIARLRAAGLWDKALVIVTADHGVGLRPGGSRRPVTRADFPGIAGVPLFVKLPGQRKAAIADTPARTVDVLPTIAAVIGAQTAPGVDGQTLTKPLPAVTPSVRNGRRGRFVSVPLATFVRARNAELARQRRLFPDPANVFRLASTGSSAGGSLGAAAAAGGVRATIEGAGEYGRVRVASGVLPVYLTGHFTSGGRAGMPLAFAIDGRVVATGRSYRVGRQLRFSTMLRATSLHSGVNRVTVFAVDGATRTPIARAGG